MPGLAEIVSIYMGGDEISSLSSGTQKRTRIALNGLIKVAGPKTLASKLNRSHVDSTVAGWRTRGLAESTVNTYKVSLRTFGAFLFETRYNRTDPCKHLKIVKTKADMAKREPLTADQVVKLIKAADLYSDRDGCTVRLLLASGARSSEVCGLTWADVDFATNTLRFYRPKIKDHHYIPAHPAMMDFLADWKARYEAFHGPVKPAWYVVPALATDRPCTAASARLIVPTRPQTNLLRRMKMLLGVIGVEDLRGKGVHTTRRTAAGRMFQATGDISVVQDLLGHASPEMSAKYIGVDIRQARLRDAMMKMDF